MHLVAWATMCQECKSRTDTCVTGQRFKNGRCRVRVDCNRCGCFSHYLELGSEAEAAIRSMVTQAEQSVGTESIT